MAGISAIGWDSYAVLSSGTVSRVVSFGSATSQTATAAATTASASSAQSAANSRELIEKAATNSGKVLEATTALRQELGAATQAGTALDSEQLAALTQRIASVRDQVNGLGREAAVGGANLLGGTATSVTVTSAVGDRVRVSSQKLDGATLGLDGLAVTDAASLRQAAAAVALGTGRAQRIDYNLQVAKSVIAPSVGSPGLDAYAKIRTAEEAGPAAGSALASVQTAVNNQATVNAWTTEASDATSWFATKTRTNSILDLFA